MVEVELKYYNLQSNVNQKVSFLVMDVLQDDIVTQS